MSLVNAELLVIRTWISPDDASSISWYVNGAHPLGVEYSVAVDMGLLTVFGVHDVVAPQ